MKQTDFYKIGVSRRCDELAVYRRGAMLMYGFIPREDDTEGGWQWRKGYDHTPSLEEVRSDILALINLQTDQAILSGFVWRGKSVWLSRENQMNFKAAYDLAVQMNGDTLPVKFKLGEDEEGNAVYHTFESMDDFTDFYTKAVAHVNDCLTKGWEEKDGVDWLIFSRV